MSALSKAMVVVSVCLAATSWGAEEDMFQVQGDNAYALFTRTSDCSFTSMQIFAASSMGMMEMSGARSPTTGAHVIIRYSHFTYCSGSTTHYTFEGHVMDAAFNMNGIGNATLTGTFPVVDSNGRTFLADVNVRWAGAGGVTHGHVHAHHAGPGYLLHYMSDGLYRLARVSGTVIIPSPDGEDYVAGLESTGFLSQSSSADVMIQ